VKAHPAWCLLQVVDMKNEVVNEALYEEASILRRREVDYRWVAPYR